MKPHVQCRCRDDILEVNDDRRRGFGAEASFVSRVRYGYLVRVTESMYVGSAVYFTEGFLIKSTTSKSSSRLGGRERGVKREGDNMEHKWTRRRDSRVKCGVYLTHTDTTAVDNRTGLSKPTG